MSGLPASSHARSKASPRGPAVGMGEIKEMMRNSLSVKTFANEPVNKPAGFDEARQTAAAHRSPMRSTKLGQLEQHFDVVNFGKS